MLVEGIIGEAALFLGPQIDRLKVIDIDTEMRKLIGSTIILEDMQLHVSKLEPAYIEAEVRCRKPRYAEDILIPFD